MFPFDFSPFAIQVAGPVLRAGFSVPAVPAHISTPRSSFHASQEESSEHRGGTLDTIRQLFRARSGDEDVKCL